MTTGYYCAIFPFFGGGEKKKDDKKTKAFYDWATTGIPVKNILIGRGVCMGDITTILGKKREYDLPRACTNRF